MTHQVNNKLPILLYWRNTNSIVFH